MIWIQKIFGIMSLCLALFLTYLLVIEQLLYDHYWLPYIISITIVALLIAALIFLLNKDEDG